MFYSTTFMPKTCRRALSMSRRASALLRLKTDKYENLEIPERIGICLAALILKKSKNMSFSIVRSCRSIVMYVCRAGLNPTGPIAPNATDFGAS